MNFHNDPLIANRIKMKKGWWYSIQLFCHWLSCFLHWKVEFELRWEFLFRIKAVGEINPSKAAVCMNLNSQRLNIISTICSSGQIGKIQLNLIPSVIHPQWHGADIWLHSSHGLKIRCSETSSDILIVQYLNLKCEVFLQILNNHNQKRQLYSKGSRRVSWACNVCWLDIWSNYFQDVGLNIFILWPFYMAIDNFFIPYLQRLAPKAI